MNYTEEMKNVFDDKTSVLAHCISSDYVMGAGIAAAFTKMGVKAYLKANYPEEWDGHGRCIICEIPDGDNKGQLVANLITKELVSDKPTYTSVIEALADMKGQMEERGLNKVCMPFIGCGIDGLKWTELKPEIDKLFGNTDFDVVVRYRNEMDRDTAYGKPISYADKMRNLFGDKAR